jgi:hypothetical protein
MKQQPVITEKKSALSVCAVVAANLVPLVMAALGYWGVGDILALYWAETGVVGVFAVLRFLFACAPVPAHKPLSLNALKNAPAEKTLPLVLADWGIVGKTLLAVVFAFPYVMFMVLQGLVLYIMLEVIGTYGWPMQSIKWGLLGLFVSHAISFGVDYIGSGKFRSAKPEECLDTPLHRLVIMQLALAVGAGISHSFRDSAYIMCIFVLAKLAVDLRPAKGYIG